MLIHLKLVTPDRIVYEDDVDSVSLPTPDGEITVLPHHVPLVSLVVAGLLRVRKADRVTELAVSGGAIEVDGKNLTILADTAERAEELEEEAIEKARKKAEEMLKEKRGDEAGYTEALASLEREMARLRVVRRHRSKKVSFDQSKTE